MMHVLGAWCRLYSIEFLAYTTVDSAFSGKGSLMYWVTEASHVPLDYLQCDAI